MMACSYLSAAGIKPEPSMTGCWTPPYSLTEPEPSRVIPPVIRPPLPPIVSPSVLLPEPALDLTTSLKPRAPSSSDGDSE
ncbi:unnamed protein product [Euphydryas editha]|uniref:Secreted protein n=1 Tax=Euphydryas editha TaxID=104508 RepID=A0AAU9V587_EUPED|nr:unnamed protein product [Euphydryas editha]